MKSLGPSQRAPELRFATHFLQVYRPIDNEKLKSEASEASETLQLCGCIPIDGVSTQHLFHDKRALDEKQVSGEGK